MYLLGSDEGLELGCELGNVLGSNEGMICLASQKASQKAVGMVHYLVSLKAPQKAVIKVSEMA